MSFLFERPRPRVDNAGFLEHCVSDRPQLRNCLNRWNYLYEYYDAEFCEIRRRLFRRAHGYDIADASSAQLCSIERYTACVNFKHAKDGLVRHVCDMLPVIIGTELDVQRIRHRFWSRGKPTILEDLPKLGFIIQNKNYYNFTACLTTNPKVCHIYRRNTKLQNTEVRLYFYDHNFRGNKLYLKQTLVFEKCENCVQGVDADREDATRQCNLNMYLLETLMLRNCYKHDYTFITRRCVRAEEHQAVRDTVAWLCGYRHPSASEYRRPVCGDIFPHGGTTRVLKFQCGRNASSIVLCDCSSTLLMQEFLVGAGSGAQVPEAGPSEAGPSGGCGSAPGNAGETLRFENVDKMIELNDTCFVGSAARDSSEDRVRQKMFTLFIYMHEVLLRNEDIDLLCNKCIFEGTVLYGQLMQQLGSYLCEKYPLPALFSDVVDTLVSKMRELSHTGNLYMLISRKTSIRVDLTNDMKRLLKTSVKREKMQNVDVCSNVKTFTSVGSGSTGSGAAPVECVGPATPSGSATPCGSSASSTGSGGTGGRVGIEDSAMALAAAARAAASCAGGSLYGSPSSTLDTFASNANSDFLLRRKQRQKRSVMFDCDAVRRLLDSPVSAGSVKVPRVAHSTPHVSSSKIFYTGMDPFRPDRVLILYSSVRDYNSRQLLNYGNLYLLQGISAAHYTDTEFIFEQVKRPRITNQQNSSKCALIPRGFVRFLSFYNIGNLSTAGRCMNLVARTRLSFFVNPVVQVAEAYYQWFRGVYLSDRYFHARRVSVQHCLTHEIERCPRCFLMLIINETPYCDVLVDKRLEYQLFVMSKLRWPAVQFYRKSHVVLSVSIQSGIIMLPMIVDASAAPASDDWLWCTPCDMYFPADPGFSSVRLRLDFGMRYAFERLADELCSCAATDPAPFTDGMLATCRHHVWFSPNDLAYYEQYLRTTFQPQLPQPFYYELVCHGGFSTGRNIASVDISKTIVSINAAKRRLRLGSELADPSSSASPFETLMDQNARILVYDHRGPWRPALPAGDSHMVLRNPANEPLHDIVTVPGRNTFFCCFAFGDFEGFNCEDAYVFDTNSRPFVENVIQLKVNYYKFDRSVIKTNMVQFFFKPSVTMNPGNGCTIFLGEIVTYYKLSFGSTMINVKIIRHRNNMYRYCLSYVNNAAYLRRGSPVFADLPDGRRGLEFAQPVVEVNRYNDLDQSKHNSKSSIMVLYDATVTTLNGNIVVSAQLNTRQLRFRVSLKNVQTTQKIQNNCGQKGMPVYRDLSDLYTERGGRVHIVVSSYSSLGRQPLCQLLEQRSNGGCDSQYGPLLAVHSRRQGGKQVGWAGYGEFFFSCDSPHDNIIVSGPNCGNNPMRVCNLTYYAAIDSGLSTAIFNRISDHENYKNNPANGMPLNVYKLISVYRYFNRDLDFKDFAARRVREQLRDWVNISGLGVRATLPDHLRNRLLQLRQPGATTPEHHPDDGPAMPMEVDEVAGVGVGVGVGADAEGETDADTDVDHGVAGADGEEDEEDDEDVDDEDEVDDEVDDDVEDELDDGPSGLAERL